MNRETIRVPFRRLSSSLLALQIPFRTSVTECESRVNGQFVFCNDTTFNSTGNVDSILKKKIDGIANYIILSAIYSSFFIARWFISKRFTQISLRNVSPKYSRVRNVRRFPETLSEGIEIRFSYSIETRIVSQIYEMVSRLKGNNTWQKSCCRSC